MIDKNKRVAIIGAGPAGMTAAYQLAKAGVAVEVFEAGPSVGGLAKTIELWGQRVDLGPHRFFSTDARVNGLWFEIVGRDYKIVNRLTRILYQKKFYAYPFKAWNALTNLGLFEAARCVASYVYQKLFLIRQDGSFENWVVARFGRRLFEIFFKSYSEKLWGISCKNLDSDFAAQRIKKLSLLEAIKYAVFKDKQKKHKTLLDQFAYPTGGTGMVYERMKEAICARGGQVHCQAPVSRVLTQNQSAIGILLEDGSTHLFDHVISSMPITLLVSQLSDAPKNVLDNAAALKFRNTILVYLEINAADLFPDQWIYVHSPELQTGRVTNFRNWVPTLYGNAKTTIVALEYWCYDQEALWSKSEEELILMAKREIKRIGLRAMRYLSKNKEELSKEEIVKQEFVDDFVRHAKEFEVLRGHVHKIRRCYPVYERGYKQHLKPIEQYLNSIKNLSVIGRYGAFKYNNQDHSILMGIFAAENLVNGAHHDLWGVNTDYENYQESSATPDTYAFTQPSQK